jgi:hypothetical protein
VLLLKLIRQDHVTHYGPLLLPLAIPIGVIVAAFGKEGIAPRAEGDYVGPVLLIWILVTLMLGFARVGQRADYLKMSLPLSPKKVWLARVISIFAFLVFVIVVALVIMVAAKDREQQPLIHHAAAALLMSILAVAVLGVALIQSLRPGMWEIEVERRSVAYMIAVWVLCLAILFGLLSAGPLWSAGPLVAAAILFARIWRRVPAAFTAAACEPASVGAPVALPPDLGRRRRAPAFDSSGGAAPPHWRRLMHKTIVLSLYRPVPVAAVVFAVLCFLGFYISGFYPEPLSGPVYMFWVIGLSPAFIVWPAKNVFTLDHWPVSRRLIFPNLALPAICSVWLGLMGGTIGGNLLAPQPPLREYVGTRHCPFHTRVPDRFLRVAWDGTPPAITAPWGETHQPWTCRPIRGRAALMYSPYSLPAGSSREFVAWQTSREMAAVYGARVAPGEIIEHFDRYFERREGGAWALVSWGEPLRADFPGLHLQDWSRPMAVIVLMLGIAWFLTAAWIITAFYRGVSPTLFMLVGRVIPPAIPLCFVAVVVWFGEHGYTTSWKLTAMANMLVRRLADLLPSNSLLLWGLVITLLVVFYLLAETTFRRAQSAGTGKIE